MSVAGLATTVARYATPALFIAGLIAGAWLMLAGAEGMMEAVRG